MESKLMRKVSSHRASQDALKEKTARFERFVMDFAEAGNAVVPLEQSRRVAHTLNRPVVESPHRIDHRMIVCVENIFFVFGVAGDVNLRDPLGGHTVDVRERIETVVLRGDVNIVDVKQNAAVGALDDFVEKLP